MHATRTKHPTSTQSIEGQSHVKSNLHLIFLYGHSVAVARVTSHYFKSLFTLIKFSITYNLANFELFRTK